MPAVDIIARPQRDHVTAKEICNPVLGHSGVSYTRVVLAGVTVENVAVQHGFVSYPVVSVILGTILSSCGFSHSFFRHASKRDCPNV
jgi:hypothetical protein